MIAAASVKDQELPITAKRPGVNHPTVAGRGYLGARVGCNRNALLSSTNAVGRTELANARPVHRQRQMPAIRRECNRGREPARIFQRGKIGTGGVCLDGAGIEACLARIAVEILFELADQVLEIVDLMGEIGSV